LKTLFGLRYGARGGILIEIPFKLFPYQINQADNRVFGGLVGAV
jgi:hypothetical protein